MPAAATSPAATYLERRHRFTAAADRLGRRSRVFSWLRLIALCCGGSSLLAFVVTMSANPRPWAWAAAASFALLFVLARLHDRVIRAESHWRGLAALQQEGIDRLDRRWDRLPVPQVRAPEAQAALSRDLQLFGRASLLQLLGTAQSPPGRQMLRRWLLEPAPPERVRERQRAVAALAPALDLRHGLALEGQRLARLEPDVEPFLAWAESEPWLLRRRWLLWITRLVPAVAWLTLVALALGVVPPSVPFAAFTLSFLLANLLASKLDDAHDRIAARGREIGSYADALAALWAPAAEEVEAEVLSELRGGLRMPTSGPTPARDAARAPLPAHAHLRVLQRRLELADARYSAWGRFVLDTLFQWQSNALWLLERWQVDVGTQVRGWLTALGEVEALAALANLHFEEPDWCFPRLEPAADRLVAHEVAHPLLSATQRVANDVTVGPPGTFLLVTGSNMSGKSTLLRALGTNIVLAQAGAPVCASSWVMPPLRLATSILVEDSLAEGVSFFMAEVLRMRDVVAAALAAQDTGARLLFLLDEVLRGTNSGDRQVAMREVVHRLLATGAIGAITTHDLALGSAPELQGAAVPVHFRETLHPDASPGTSAMTFDYLLRPGLATTANALQLLRMFGLRDGSR